MVINEIHCVVKKIQALSKSVVWMRAMRIVAVESTKRIEAHQKQC